MKKILIGALFFCGLGYFIHASFMSTASNCAELEATTRAEIAASQSCENDQDCLLLVLTCPYECLNPIRKDAKLAVMAALNNYNKSCLAMCPDCPKDDTSKVACISQRCTKVH